MSQVAQSRLPACKRNDKTSLIQITAGGGSIFGLSDHQARFLVEQLQALLPDAPLPVSSAYEFTMSGNPIQTVEAVSPEDAVCKAGFWVLKEHRMAEYLAGRAEPEGLRGYYVWVRPAGVGAFQAYYAAPTYKCKPTGVAIYCLDPTVPEPKCSRTDPCAAVEATS